MVAPFFVFVRAPARMRQRNAGTARTPGPNAIAAAAIAHCDGVDEDQIQRRFSAYIRFRGVTLQSNG
jgi:hypothetical protein